MAKLSVGIKENNDNSSSASTDSKTKKKALSSKAKAWAVGKTNKGTRTNLLSVRLDDLEMEKLENSAYELGVSKATYIRLAILEKAKKTVKRKHMKNKQNQMYYIIIR
ncbi:plasmid mobilization protein [Piscirickettsia litoralis]|uniref:Ribbon-helix-helix protein CopG domain-containing protein n=1 Tax=Piscirickettsia litoralis TaxID=1891921 RepID=A0ABX2ZWM7_9GAMM|nr:hypothetical protein [Piscirickettsia litoralis]ODN40991.1 hypothetical protein BGC07_18730 [Piscirickettsia litoralis]